MVDVIAHRGNSAGAPENTLAAIRSAVELGADGIEIDVRATADGRLVVMHDSSVRRTTSGSGQVDGLTLKQLRALDAGSWFGEGFRGERVPTLEEAIAASRKTRLFIELKVDGIQEEVVRLVRAGKATKRVVVTARNDQWLKRVKELEPRIAVGHILLFSLFEPLGAHGDMDYLLPFWFFMGGSFVRKAHKAGLKVVPWTVNDTNTASRLAGDGADGVMTDKPAACMGLKRVTAARPARARNAKPA